MTSSLGWVEKLTGHYILCLDSAVPANGPEVTEKAKHYFFTWEKLGLSEHVPCFVLLFLFVFACFFFFLDSLNDPELVILKSVHVFLGFDPRNGNCGSCFIGHGNLTPTLRSTTN